jgi:hypothetical protein
VPNAALYEEFKKRQEGKAFQYISKDLFSPLDLTKSVKEEVLAQRKKLESEFENLKFEAPLDRVTLQTLGD